MRLFFCSSKFCSSNVCFYKSGTKLMLKFIIKLKFCCRNGLKLKRTIFKQTYTYLNKNKCLASVVTFLPTIRVQFKLIKLIDLNI